MASMIVYSMTITSIKFSTLLLFRRIFDVSKFRPWSMIVETLCSVWLLSAILTDLLQCSPISAAFREKFFNSKQCLPVQTWYFGVAITNMMLDIVILVMPIWMIMDLRLPTAKKFKLCGIFGLGGM